MRAVLPEENGEQYLPTLANTAEYNPRRQGILLR